MCKKYNNTSVAVSVLFPYSRLSLPPPPPPSFLLNGFCFFASVHEIEFRSFRIVYTLPTRIIIIIITIYAPLHTQYTYRKISCMSGGRLYTKSFTGKKNNYNTGEHSIIRRICTYTVIMAVILFLGERDENKINAVVFVQAQNVYYVFYRCLST